LSPDYIFQFTVISEQLSEYNKSLDNSVYC